MAELVSIKRNVDVSPGQAAPAVFHCSQGDVGSKIILGLLNNGTAYSIPSGVTVTIEGSESNGSIFTPISATASGSDITFYLTGEMTAVAGPAICQAVLKSGSNILGTANFTLEVESSPMGADAPPVFTDAGWTWMLNKLTTEFVPALGNETIIDAIESKADQSDLETLENTVAGHTGSITVLNNTVNTLNQGVTENRQNIATKLNKNQGTANAGKYLKVGNDGNVTAEDLDVTTDKTLSIADKAADAKAVGDELDDLKADLSKKTGLSDDAKTALLACLSKVAWIDAHGQDYYDDLYNALYPPANVREISAVYTQSGVVYNTDSVEFLRADLVVTATYTDSTTSVVQDYTLSGSLNVGLSIITVSYGGKRATFTVSVTEEQSIQGLYKPGVSFGITGDKLYYYHDNNSANRMGFCSNSGENQIQPSGTPTEALTIYPIHVPAEATKIKVDTQDSQIGSAINTVKWDGSSWKKAVTASSYGYGTSELDISTVNDGNLYVIVLFRNSANSSAIQTADTSGWKVLWEG